MHNKTSLEILYLRTEKVRKETPDDNHTIFQTPTHGK